MVWLVCSYTAGIYINQKMLNIKRLFQRSFFAAAIFSIFVLIFLSIVNRSVGTTYMLYSVGAFFLFLLVSRAAFGILTSYLYKKEEYQNKIIFIGCNNISKNLLNFFKTNKKKTLIAGFFDNEITNSGCEYPVLGKINEALAYAQNCQIREIYCTISPKANPHILELAAAAESSFIRLKFIPDLTEYEALNCHIDFIQDMPVLSLWNEPLQSMPGRIKKRVFDISLSLFAIVFILSWLIPILGIIIVLNSKGGVFFRQIRTGKNNQPFTCIKLRTLKVNDDANKVQVTRGDQRITKVGAFLRKTNLDELPQFFNVLMGDMSVVGSRPHMIKHTEEYSKLVGNYMVRHFLKPGVTGWAQVNGHRGEIKQPQHLKNRIDHDIWYMENWNIWLDFRIVFLTFFTTIKGDKNAF
jgi:putative colanic acid biosynthesis UDP-glucose lipid carrier transferase